LVAAKKGRSRLELRVALLEAVEDGSGQDDKAKDDFLRVGGNAE
jgi:hypothetical protein